jgi:hypothetical protein
MCQFFSAIIVKDNILYNKHNDQHENLIENHNLDDSTLEPNFVRVELIPPNGNNYFEKDLNKWIFNVDQDLIPKWFDKKVAAAQTRATLKSFYNEIIFEDKKDLVFKNNKRVFLKNSSAILCDRSSAKLWDRSSATLHDESSAELWDGSLAILHNKSSAILHNGSSATLRNGSSTILWDNS